MHVQNTQKKNNLWLHLTIQNLPDSQLRIESKTEPSIAKVQNYMERGGGHHTYFFDEGNNWDGEKT